MLGLDTISHDGIGFLNRVDHAYTIHVVSVFCHPSPRGADIEAADTSSCSPLMTAARHGQVLALKTLRHRGAAIDTLDDNGKSCVFLAAEANHVPVLRVCLLN